MIVLLASFCCDLLSSVTRPWRRLFWLALHLYISAWSVVLNRLSEAFTRFIGVVTAYRREKELELRLCSLRHDYEDLKLRNGELQRKLDALTRYRRRVMETLDLVMADKEKAVNALKVLKNKVQNLETTNQQLADIEEVLRRALEENLANLKAANKPSTEKLYNSFSADSQFVQAKRLTDKTLLNKDTLKDKESSGVPQPVRAQPPCRSGLIVRTNVETVFVVESENGAAFASTMFSALLSTLVAIIAWESKSPCKPLVIALFSVVGMSHISVVRFFTKLQTQRGFLAVALLSLNWFVLGTLAHPALPHVGPMGSGVLLAVGGRFLKFLGFENIMRVVEVTSI
ncbi:uncharacterized protein [Physcomitrium patens]|uniref:Uncharacterized protein n=1 Tax=Physcomitrium patens TaxID=3218 RepID=A9U022_PHYPA|nr:uncharacterized protein LOC112277619 [Physcomitrium patens]XP_024365938.1 uncharacterized protein LOC112277619 [Physcomitrium patens]XP_024365940.1 uncharacterized protein LOC112277619 [Physcomitrium patens]XP_024365941.1 uncharacterized protein LOC112277619 [Physcomitrium patens]PNR27222.1 hypothetical protein PHYPA_029374 [Physcomitrium patens]|eukprot:XP_024365937.1 uncharacterized protein LOC112277619 [Physcomitrella patens]